jgi:glutaminase
MMSDILEYAVSYAKPFIRKGRLPEYIPALAHINPDYLGVCIHTLDGTVHTAGDCEIPFSIQSVSKLFSLSCVLNTFGIKAVMQKTGVEPSGNPFYSLVQLEYETGKPRNPLINAGAIAVTGMIPGTTSEEKFIYLLHYIRNLAGEDSITMNPLIYESEASTSHRNRAVGHFMKHFGIIDGDVDTAVDAYFRQCSIEMNCVQLSRMGLYLANHGTDPLTLRQITSPECVRFMNAVLLLCGLYDASGEFAVTVGIPAKSGVGGGILGIVPGRMSIAVFGPALDEKGNSIGGVKLLEKLSQDLQLSLFS